MSNEHQVLHQVLSDPYRSKADKDAARARLDQLSGIVRERTELDKNANGLDRLARQVAALYSRVDVLEARLAGTPGPAEAEAVTIPPPTPDVETVPQVNIPDDRGQKQGRPKNRYVVEGERGSWGIQDTETGLFVYPVQKLRKDADHICRQINAGKISPVTSAIGLHGEAEASVALDKDPDCGTQSIEAQQGTEAPQVEEPAGKTYQSYEEKPAPEVRPDRERSTSAVGRVPWYAK